MIRTRPSLSLETEFIDSIFGEKSSLSQTEHWATCRSPNYEYKFNAIPNRPHRETQINHLKPRMKPILPISIRRIDYNCRFSQRNGILRLTIGTLLVSLLAVEPALAQSNAVCDAERLPEMISGFFQLTTALGLLGLVVVWQANSLAEMFTIGQDHREGFKRHKRTALKSTVILLVLGPLYTVAGATMNLPLADCINLTPW